MDKFLVFTIVGLSLAAIYAVISSGLVLTYTTTGIFNFAHGAIGMLAAFAYWQLRFDWGWPAPIALAVVLLLLAPAFGLVLERVIMRGLQGTSEATKLVVSISLLVAMIGLANLIWTPGESRPMDTFFKGQKVDLGITTITYHQAITIVTAIVVAVGLRFLLYRTRIGVSMRANVDDRNLALLNGARPDRIGLLSWAIGSSLAAIGGILIAPALTLDPGSLSLLIVNAYAAAIFGRLRSLPLTFVGAIVLGLTEGYLAAYLPGENQYLAGFRPAAAAIVLFLVLLVMPNPRLRTRSQLREFFPAPSPSGMAMVAVAVVLAGVVMVTTLDTTSIISYGQMFPLAIVALSLVPLVGYAGQISLAQLSFAGVGAIVVAHHGGGGSPLGLALAVVVTALVGGLVALPVRRLSGIYLALATAAFAVALDRWVFNLPDFDIGPLHISLFQLGSTEIAPLKVFGYAFDTPSRLLMLSAVAFSLTALVVAGVRWSGFGRQLVAMRDSEAACATLGLNLVWPRLAVFMLSAGIAGLGGALYGMQLGSVSPERFNLVSGLPLFMLVVVGGAGLVGGALFAGIGLYGIIPLTSALFSFVAKINAVSPGLTGVGLGRNPSGVIPLVQEGVRPLRRDRVVLPAMAVAMVAVYALRQADAYGNWPFVALLLLVFVVANAVAGARARPGAAERRAAAAATSVGDLDWVGITSPWTSGHLAQLESAFAADGLPPMTVPGRSRAHDPSLPYGLAGTQIREWRGHEATPTAVATTNGHSAESSEEVVHGHARG
ncbi:ABC transporter permease [Aquihabitans sp. G128]|uniref:ABC transporter permease n=1 Tax=Aquihabitans sp. G128 TaxID=2849779 RepID=UPI001C21383C|nr:ABC transporter permease [Aquihabitans sp. G128]QXC61390.1 ABC transporter permease [Aquihabitans sp. G128]